MKTSRLGWQCSFQESRPTNRTLNVRHEKPFCELLVSVVQEIPQITNYCYCPWLLPRGGRLIIPIAMGTMYLRHRARCP